jgi:hypothetical protein
MFTKPMPRFVIAKILVTGTTAFYFNIPTLYRKLVAAFPVSRWALTTALLVVMMEMEDVLRR